jgi:hypothetical protein
MERESFYNLEQPEQEHEPDANALLQTLSNEVRAYVHLCWAAEDPKLKKEERKWKHEQMRMFMDTMLQTPTHAAQYREELSRYAEEKNREMAQEKGRK